MWTSWWESLAFNLFQKGNRTGHTFVVKRELPAILPTPPETSLLVDRHVEGAWRLWGLNVSSGHSEATPGCPIDSPFSAPPETEKDWWLPVLDNGAVGVTRGGNLSPGDRPLLALLAHDNYAGAHLFEEARPCGTPTLRIPGCAAGAPRPSAATSLAVLS